MPSRSPKPIKTPPACSNDSLCSNSMQLNPLPHHSDLRSGAQLASPRLRSSRPSMPTPAQIGDQPPRCYGSHAGAWATARFARLPIRTWMEDRQPAWIIAKSATTICVCAHGFACSSCYQSTAAAPGPDFRWCMNRQDTSWGSRTRSRWTLRLCVFVTRRLTRWERKQLPPMQWQPVR
jgi:hypothetical protein